jgi:hypothetical protein
VHVDRDVRRRRARRQPGQQGRRPGSDVVVRVGDTTLPADDRPLPSVDRYDELLAGGSS